jgi:hypothetical protein
MDSFNSPTTRPLFRAVQIVWYFFGLLEILLTFRFVLKFLGANSTAGFTAFIYGITRVFVAPFVSVFRVTYVSGSIFEWTTALAMFVYLVIAMAIIRLFLIGKTVSTSEAANGLNDQEK